MLQLHWKSIIMWKLVRIHMWSLHAKIQRCVTSIWNDLIVAIIFICNIGLCGVKSISIQCINETYSALFCSGVFSRAAIVCLIVGTITLLAMVTIAIYRSSQSTQLIKGSSGTGQGMLNIRTAYVYCLVLLCEPNSHSFLLLLPSLQGHPSL